ncbi:Small nuclear ribonucleoprotein family protein isoform 1 [Hibiscus syriacus]|uniref:Small nuclear ribonucleoprotein family protein isoform 1 n=1 Tax=Hibiscus syriacus TaxID=106335 RepID=A0A6A3CS04_HIBSY|nr:uncharacterized protein LOC120144695 [Hibiscus syriacus]KAE8731983.1 Small nuclear ribonucleoprotein family protein isoform 1 [Hibiscus syriacus]
MGSASEIAAKLNLVPNPEGGLYSETFRDTSIFLSKSHLPPRYKVGREMSTCIYFMLQSGTVSRLHRIPCAEIWHFYKGEPLTIVELDEKDGKVKLTCVGPDIVDDQRVQYTVPPYVWFGAFPAKDLHISSDGGVTRAEPRDPEAHYSLVGCTCAPAFLFQDFELGKRSELVASFPDYEPIISFLTLPD